MATLVLTAAGSVFGPIGGAIGALIGQSIDSRIFKPKGREGPRLQDLRIQTSSYGSPIPQLFGTLRVAGTVIWATDLVETRSRRGGGKGRPSTTSYSYSASFAVALSARPIRAVRRIWADGNLLRGASGDWKQATGFRLNPGGEDQAPDPFIASAEDAAPAYRGCAYAVFENMALEPYGNRIPSLTFEVEADVGPVDVAEVLQELSQDTVTGSGVGAMAGFAASGESLAGLIGELAAVYPLTLRDDGDRLTIEAATDAPVVIGATEMAESGRSERPAAVDVPAALTIAHYDPARDYQAGLQAAGTADGRGTERVELPAVLGVETARGLAEAALVRRARERARRSIQCGWRRMAVAPGTAVRIGDAPGKWRVLSRSVERGGIRLELRSDQPASIVARPAEGGRNVPAPDVVHGPTRLRLLDLPNLADDAPTLPVLHVAAAGTSPGWRRADLLVSTDGGSSWQPAGSSALPATMGVTETALPAASAALFDRRGDVIVALGHEGMVLEDANDARLLGGANLATVGGELIQFGSALPLGGNRWRLSRLLRGRRGTEWAIGTHAAGESFVLLDADSLFGYATPLTSLGSSLRVMASGIGDPVPIEATVNFAGESLRPPAPVHLTARPRADGGFDLSWTRRSRAGWAWGELDAPLGEATERYRLTFRLADGVERVTETSAPVALYQAAQVGSDCDAGAHVDILVSQLGTHAASRPASIRLFIEEI